MISRRAFSRKFCQAVTSYALLESVFRTGAWHIGKVGEADHWAIQLNEYCRDLHKASISPKEWQQLSEKLLGQVPLADIIHFINFEELVKGFQFPDLGVDTRYVKFPRLIGLPEKTVFVKKIFGMSRDRAIIPHGHSNMASLHLVLKGDMHLRQYDKLHQEDNHLIIRPTVDRIIHPGSTSSISDDQNNIHWFIANSQNAFTLDIIMLDLNGQSYDIHNLDIEKAEPQNDGSIRVPELAVSDALKKYGKDHH